METIGTNYKEAMNNNFRYTLIERDVEGIAKTLNTSVKGSNNMSILPKVEKIELERIDDLHDKLSLSWSDYTIEGVVTWKVSDNKLQKAMVFYGIE
jgi:DNA-binding Xre family transcriptional regulator